MTVTHKKPGVCKRPPRYEVSDSEAQKNIIALKSGGRSAWLCKGCGHELAKDEILNGPCLKCNGIVFEKVRITVSDGSDESDGSDRSDKDE